MVLAFDTRRLLADPVHALIGRLLVGDAPVGMAVFDNGARLAVTNSNRFGDSNAVQSLTIIDTKKISSGEDAILGSVRAGRDGKRAGVPHWSAYCLAVLAPIGWGAGHGPFRC